MRKVSVVLAISVALLSFQTVATSAAPSKLTMTLKQTPGGVEPIITLYGSLKPAKSGVKVTVQMAFNYISSKHKQNTLVETLTMSEYKIFINSTLGFDVPVKVAVKLTPLNSRVQVDNVTELIMGANSRTQLSIPFTAIAPGATTVLAQITNTDGEFVGPASRLTINVTFFDSRVTYFTIGAALLLFIAAFTQTIRRIRRGRHEK